MMGREIYAELRFPPAGSDLNCVFPWDELFVGIVLAVSTGISCDSFPEVRETRLPLCVMAATFELGTVLKFSNDSR